MSEKNDLAEVTRLQAESVISLIERMARVLCDADGFENLTKPRSADFVRAHRMLPFVLGHGYNEGWTDGHNAATVSSLQARERIWNEGYEAGDDDASYAFRGSGPHEDHDNPYALATPPPLGQALAETVGGEGGE